MTYKLELLMELNEDDWQYRTAYIDVSKIYGFTEAPYINDQPDAVNVFIYGGMMTILQQDHILKYLNERFKKPVKNE
jgi:hypothetical protein